MFQRTRQWVSDHIRGFTLSITVVVSIAMLMRGPEPNITTVRWAALHVVSWGQSILHFPIRLAQLDRTNRYLRGELLRRVSLESELHAVRAENERLRRMLDFARTSHLELLAARVEAHDGEFPPASITLNVGKAHGVDAYQAVVSPEGLVGRVEPEPGGRIAMVRLLTDEGVRVSAVVDNETRPMGIVRYDGRRLVLSNVPLELPVEVDQRVYTSGVGGIFPRGILIGRVAKVTSDPHELFKLIEVDPAARLGRLEEVFVVRSVEDSTAVETEHAVDR